jgi:carbamoyl-phosphate synthase large subunit
MTNPDGALDRQKVLVTGGSGVIATELLAQLSAAGADVLSVDRLPLADAAPPGVRHLVGDLGDMDLEPLATFGARHLLHLAATFERSVESPEFWQQNWNDNVVATHRLVELAERTGGVESFVFASSYLVYDPSQYLTDDPAGLATLLSEESRLSPRNLCGAAKLYGEAEITFARDVAAAPFRAVFARIFRVYGRGSRDVVSRWVRAALAGEAIEVYHPENRFDYVFSGDVAEGLLRMATTPAAEGPINLARGEPREVREVIAAIERITGTPLSAHDRAVDEPWEASGADLTRLRAMVGWSPATSLEAGIERLVAFERDRIQRGEAVGSA